MRLNDSAKTAFAGLRHSKTRSLLTMLGIIIGISSVILLMSIGQSAQNLILDQVKGVGSNLIFIIPGGDGGSRNAAPASSMGVIIKTLVARDIDALKREVSVESALPEVRGQAKASTDINDKTVTYSGVTGDYFVARNLLPISGYPFSKADVDSYSRVAVIGKKIAADLFGARNPLGRTVRLKDINFRVVGVLDTAGYGPLGIDQDNAIFIPVTVAQKLMLGINYYNIVTVQAKDVYDISFTENRVINVLRQNHKITDPTKDDFMVRTQADALDLLSSITTIMTLFLAAIASISLVVGGIGIMNIMLVSVVERTKEIGLRKAVGASNRDIMEQFLIESIMLTFVGGLLGIIVGAVLDVIAYFILVNFTTIGWTFSLPISSILLAVGVSTFIGVIFGLYPARQAAIKNPIDSLRYE